jgi:hypothetical protein
MLSRPGNGTCTVGPRYNGRIGVRSNHQSNTLLGQEFGLVGQSGGLAHRRSRFDSRQGNCVSFNINFLGPA